MKKQIRDHPIPSTKSSTRTKIKEGNKMAQSAVQQSAMAMAEQHFQLHIKAHQT